MVEGDSIAKFAQSLKKGVGIVQDEALIEMGLRWQNLSRAIVPVLTSWLWQHILFYFEGHDTIVLIADTVDPPYRADIDRGVVQYAEPVEFGSLSQRAQPYFNPALRSMLSNPIPTLKHMDKIWLWRLGKRGRPPLLSEITVVERR